MLLTCLRTRVTGTNNKSPFKGFETVSKGLNGPYKRLYKTMREYGQIQCALWTHHRFKNLSMSSKCLFNYILTGPHSNGLGCYSLPLGYALADLKTDHETVSKGFAELLDKGWVYYCEATEFVFIKGYLRWNPLSNANVAKARFKEFKDIPSDFAYMPDVARDLLEFGNHLSKPFETLLQTVSKQDPTQPNPNQEEPKEIVGTSEEPEGSTKPPAKSKKPVAEIYYSLANELSKKVLARFPSMKINFDVWADDIRKIIELDNRDADELTAVWDFIDQHQDGKFRWGDNCRTPGKLRERNNGLQYYDMINHQRNTSNTRQDQNQGPSAADEWASEGDTFEGQCDQVGAA